MNQLVYKKYFKKDHWGDFGLKVCKKLRKESVTVTCLPAGGKRYFLRHIIEYYKTITKDDQTIIISFEILPSQNKIFHLSSTINKQINYHLNFPKYLEDLSCEETLKEIVKRNNKLLIIINRFERLSPSPETMIFLESLRIIDPFKLRFFLGCDIGCITEPETYRPAGILTSANIEIIPPFNIKMTERSFEINNKIYEWKVPTYWSKQIYTLSGGNPGLVKYIIKFIHENKPSTLTTKLLTTDPAINFKLKNIFEKLKKCGLIKGNNLDLTKADLLEKLGVINKNKKLRIKLLEPFLIKEQKEIKFPTLNKILSTQELQLFQLLNSNPEKIISLHEISKALWGRHEAKKYSLWAIYKVISTLSKKLNKSGMKIKNYRGRGYALIKKKLNSVD